MVFQHSALFDSLTVGDNVGFLLREHTSLQPARIKVRSAPCPQGVSPSVFVQAAAPAWTCFLALGWGSLAS